MLEARRVRRCEVMTSRRPSRRRQFAAYAPAILMAAVLLFVGTRERIPVPPTELPVDKVGHFMMYGVLGALAAWGWLRADRWPRAVIPFALAVSIGLLDELLQTMVPGRTAELGDWIADAAGVSAGFLLVVRLLGRRHRNWTA
jgi:VanZ family protein